MYVQLSVSCKCYREKRHRVFLLRVLSAAAGVRGPPALL